MLLNRQFGEYVLLRRLAVGGQSEVFLAMKQGPRDFTRPVVIKALPREARDDERLVELFYREAYISSRFSHPNVINVHDARVIESDHCMLMDFVTGQTVADIAQRGYKRGDPPSLTQVVQMVADACAGLDYVHDFRDLDNHAYSVVHRDVSPQNLMVTYQGTSMVFDFGIAHIEGYPSDGDPTLAGGKYAYMSPEQLEGDAVDPRSDIFSLGIILYELTTGYRLFRRKTQPAVIKAVVEEPIRSPRELKSSIPQFLEDIIMRSLERDPGERYQTAGVMREDLNRFLEMTSEGQDIRRGLGRYVDSLFQKERDEIAETLRSAPRVAEQSEPLRESGLTDLRDEEFEAGREPTLELEVSREDLTEARRVAAAEKASGGAASTGDDSGASSGKSAGSPKKKERLESELGRLRRHQTRLYLIIGILLTIALLVGIVRFADDLGAAPADAEEKTVEIE